MVNTVASQVLGSIPGSGPLCVKFAWSPGLSALGTLASSPSPTLWKRGDGLNGHSKLPYRLTCPGCILPLPDDDDDDDDIGSSLPRFLKE